MSKPVQIRMGGYGPASTCFSLALRNMGERLMSQFSDAIEVKYVWNIMDLGYKAEDILWLVESGVLTLGYQSSSYFCTRVPDLACLDLPFLFADNTSARGAMDGTLGQAIRDRLEASMGYRILGYFENGLRHLSNRVRPVRCPADLKGLRIRVLPSPIQARTFELLAAEPHILDLTEALTGIAAGKLDAQENPLANTVTYGVHNYHQHHTLTGHSYLSRPIFVHRPSFDSYPPALQGALNAAVREAVALQRQLVAQEEQAARAVIEAAGGRIITLTPHEQMAFVTAVQALHEEARAKFDPALLALLDLY